MPAAPRRYLASARGACAWLGWCALSVLPALAANTPDSADAAYQSALQALARNDWVQAELALERTIMLEPNHAEALLQLALLLAQRKQPQAARALITSLLQDPRTPPAHRQRLQHLIDNTAAPAPQPASVVTGTSGRLTLSTGRSSNPLGYTQADALTLTLPQGDVKLALPRQAQTASLHSISLAQYWPSGLGLALSASQSNAASASRAWSLSASAPLAHLTPVGALPMQLLISTAQGLDGASRHSLGLLHTSYPLQISAGLYREPASRRQGWYAQARLGGTSPSLAGQSWLAYEQAQAPASPAWRLGGQWRLALGARTQAELLAQGQWDTRGYNPLLANNAARKLLTTGASLTQTWSAGAGANWQASLYAQRRYSNLALFANQNKGFTLAYSRNW